jgi:CTD small phosphatase-like protein 2
VDDQEVFVSYRPYLFEMLRTLQRHCELIIFTASHRPYAETIVHAIEFDMLGQEKRAHHSGRKLFSHILTREQCIHMPFQREIRRNTSSSHYWVKDLRVLVEGRSMRDILLVDNRALSFAHSHLCNGLPISDYDGDKSDCQLESLTAYLMQSFIVPRLKDA